jgi:hypothetical protein
VYLFFFPFSLPLTTQLFLHFIRKQVTFLNHRKHSEKYEIRTSQFLDRWRPIIIKYIKTICISSTDSVGRRVSTSQAMPQPTQPLSPDSKELQHLSISPHRVTFDSQLPIGIKKEINTTSPVVSPTISPPFEPPSPHSTHTTPPPTFASASPILTRIQRPLSTSLPTAIGRQPFLPTLSEESESDILSLNEMTPQRTDHILSIIIEYLQTNAKDILIFLNSLQMQRDVMGKIIFHFSVIKYHNLSLLITNPFSKLSYYEFLFKKD